MNTQQQIPQTRYQAKKMYPWAVVIAKVCGGYKAFRSYDEYMTWKGQK